MSEELKRTEKPHPNLQAGAAGVKAIDPNSLPPGEVVHVVTTRRLHAYLDSRSGEESVTLALPRAVAAEKLGYTPPGDHQPEFRLATPEEIAAYTAAHPPAPR